MGVTDELQAVVIRKKGFELPGRGSLIGAEFSSGGVSKAEAPGMQHEPSRLDGLTIRVGIDRIPQKRASEVLHMHPDLMGAPGVEMAEDEGRGRGLVTGKDVVVGDGGSSGTFPGVQNGLLLAVDRVASNMGEDRSGGLNRRAFSYRKIELGGLAGRELVKERPESPVRPCGDNATACVLVESMHDSRALFPADPGQGSLAVVQEGVDKGSVGITCGGMDDEAHWFVDDDQILVLMQDVERNVLGSEACWLRLGKGYRDGITGGDWYFRPCLFSVEEDVSILEEGLDTRAGEFGEFLSQEQVNSLPVAFLDGDGHELKVEQEEVRGK